jgi:MFS family permease
MPTRTRPLTPAALVWLLGVTQIIGYGTVYYAFAILAGDIAADYGWPVSRLFGLFSLALVAGGLVAPWVGRLIDRKGAAPMMAAGSLAVAAALALTAFAPGPIAFAAGLVAIEVAAALVLYDPAFAALVQATGLEARTRITHLTLIAGFASTIFWPVTSWLHGVMDWRSVYLVFAAANLLVCLPIHLLIARVRPAAGDPAPSARPSEPLPTPPALDRETARKVFTLMTLAFAISGFVLSAMLAQMVPALAAIGLGGSALVVSTLFGPAQVLVRFVNMVFGARRHPLTVSLVSLAMFPASVLILAVTAPSPAGAAAFAVLFGFGSGLMSIVRGTLPLAVFGTASYGTRLGRMALVRQFLGAVAPFAFAAHLELAGPTAALATLIAVGCVGVVSLAALWPLLPRAPAGGDGRGHPG